MIKLHKPFEEDFRISQGFGDNPDAYDWIKDVNGNPIKGHNGVDFGYNGRNDVKLFNPFPARHNVVVSKVGWDPQGYGHFLRLWDKTQRFVILMAHCREVHATEWESSGFKEQVAVGDNTGWSTGPHLHLAGYHVDEAGYRQNRDNGFDGYINLMDPREVEWIDEIKDWKEYFLFDVTKRLPEDIFIGLNFDEMYEFPEETSLDSIHREWNSLYEAGNKIAETNKKLIEAHDIMKAERDRAVEKYSKLEIKYNKLKDEKMIVTVPQAIEVLARSVADFLKEVYEKWLAEQAPKS